MTRERDNRGAGGLLCSYPCKKCNFICVASALVLGCLGLNQVKLNQDRTRARFCMSEYFGFQADFKSRGLVRGFSLKSKGLKRETD